MKNRVGNIAVFDHKQGKGFGKRAAHLYPIFWEYPPGGGGVHTAYFKLKVEEFQVDRELFYFKDKNSEVHHFGRYTEDYL